MRTLQTILGILSISFLSFSCVTQTRKPPQMSRIVERCVVSVQFEICRCHKYMISNSAIGRVSDSYDMPYNHCDKFIGFNADDFVDIITDLREVLQVNVSEKYRPRMESKKLIMPLIDEVDLK